jgi:hypothetical protein
MSIKIRNMVKGEELPEALRTGYESADNADFDWIWVAEHEGRITAIFVTAPAHVAVLFIRLISTSDAHPNDVRAILVYACAVMKERGFQAYFTWLDPTKEVERTLMDIFIGAGGTKFPNEQILCMGVV